MFPWYSSWYEDVHAKFIEYLREVGLSREVSLLFADFMCKVLSGERLAMHTNSAIYCVWLQICDASGIAVNPDLDEHYYHMYKKLCEDATSSYEVALKSYLDSESGSNI